MTRRMQEWKDWWRIYITDELHLSEQTQNNQSDDQTQNSVKLHQNNNIILYSWCIWTDLHETEAKTRAQNCGFQWSYLPRVRPCPAGAGRDRHLCEQINVCSDFSPESHRGALHNHKELNQSRTFNKQNNRNELAQHHFLSDLSISARLSFWHLKWHTNLQSETNWLHCYSIFTK